MVFRQGGGEILNLRIESLLNAGRVGRVVAQEAIGGSARRWLRRPRWRGEC
jgi:hypothetical protein